MPLVQLAIQGLQSEDGAVDGVDVEEALQVRVPVDCVSGWRGTKYSRGNQ